MATTAFLVAGLYGAAGNAASTANELNTEKKVALGNLYKATPLTSDISNGIRAALVLPDIVKAGLVFGGAPGECVLIKSASADSYCNSLSRPWELQADVQLCDYAVVLTNNTKRSYLDKSEGREISVGPAVVLVNEWVAENFSRSTLKGGAHAFIFAQRGLLASLSIEGATITRIKRGDDES